MESKQGYTFTGPALRLLGYAGMIALVILAAVFFRERAWFLDIAYQTFLMVNEGTVQVMVNRFGSAVVQLLPLLAIKAEAPLAVVSLLYSISFPLLFLFFYWLTVKVLRNDRLGWAIVLLYTLIVYDAFYWATSEQQQGLGAVLVFFAYWLRFPRQDRRWMWLVSALGVVILAYYHPLIFISFFFLWAFFGLHLREKLVGRPYWLMAGGMLLVLAVKSLIFANWYDNDKYSTFSTNLVKFFPNYFDFPAHAKFLENALSLWYFFPVFMLLVTAFYAYRRYWLKLALVWVTGLGYLMLLHIGAPNATNRFYVEVNYMALTIFVMVPFLFDITPLLRERTLFWLFAGILVLRLVTIAAHHTPFEERWQWIAQRMSATPPEEQRFFLDEDSAPMDTLLMSWAVPYESLIITHCRSGREGVKTLLIHPDTLRFGADLHRDSVFITPFQTFPASILNRHYFPLPEQDYFMLSQ
ncbi:hypothetical protein [Flavilitoribacter nigricans]|uniref:Glycosyltransferase RgtA/B/C/D-like domain-containing protein n=1 Tax=Flavilitoribacter nigricans (strain ATCC 23147 / DSM 23189 / NBRC 102662 / NCIMB 1420 / SS-2) TaxID=1122177 RepID=A0A2D0MYE8_FLAN2|nr:hypothetical protein [Flavilitoribacter nigricans]PHN01247.1 hypothetical protein CRP01_38225 [Flavilitoribacter nigricans DSM 23189 = NBRC 102662]